MTTEPNAALVGRDELRKQVCIAIEDVPVEPDGDWDEEGYEYWMVWRPVADKIIALVQAARDAEIREMLLSDGAISVMTDGVDRLRDEYRNDLLKVFNYIGLGDGTGGQG